MHRPRTLGKTILALALVGSVMSTNVASAQDHAASIEWKPGWRRADTTNYVIAGVSIVGVIGTELVLDTPRRNFGGEFYGDAFVREHIVADSRAGRGSAASISDYGLYGMIAYPVLDAVAMAWLVHGNSDTAWQLTIVNAQGLGMAGFVGRLGQKLVGRERPYVQECEATDDAYHKFCPPTRGNESFLSGHTAMSSAGAALTCLNHLHLPLYGGGWPDRLACAGAIGIAVTTATLRLIADMHYASDIVLGMTTGAAAGFLLPYLLHYQMDDSDAGAMAGGAWIPFGDQDNMGLRYFRLF